MLPLSSLLLQRGVATLAELEDALARQVVHGGDLPTNLFEVATVDEHKLVEVVADCDGLKPAPPGPLPDPEPDALRAVPADVAARVPLLPLRLVSETLVVVVAEPMGSTLQEELAFMLGVQFDQKMSTWPRVLQALAKAYDRTLDRRCARIVARLDGLQDPAPSEAPPPPMGDSLLPPQFRRGPVAAAPSSDASVWSQPTVPVDGTSKAGAPSAPPAPDAPHGAEASQASSPAAVAAPGIPRARAKRCRGPFTLVAARDALDTATENGTAISVLFDFAKQFFEYTALFVVRGDLAEGMDAHGPGASSVRIRGVGVPLEMPSVLSAARDAMTHVLAVPSNDGIDAFLRQDLQRPMNARVLTIPLSVRNRVVALVYGDDGNVDVDLNLVGDVLAMAPLTGAALERLILRRKLAARTSSAPPAKDPEASPRRTAHAEGLGANKRQTLRGLQAVTGHEVIASQAQPLVAPFPSQAPDAPSDPPVPRHDTSPFVGTDDRSAGQTTGVSPAARSVRSAPPAQSPPEPAKGESVSPVAESVRSDDSPIPSPDTLLGIGPASPVEVIPLRQGEGAPADAPPEEVPASVASGPTLVSLENRGERPELEAESEEIDVEVEEDVGSEVEPAGVDVDLEDDGPEVSVGEADGDDDMVEAVLVELQSTPPPLDDVQRGSDEEELPDVPPSDGAVVQEPMAPPKSQSPSDVGLPLVIVNVGAEIDRLLDRLEAKGLTAEESERLRGELRSFGSGWIEPAMARFPGRVVETIELSHQSMPAMAASGPLLRFIVEQGSVAAPRLLDQMSRPDPEIRLWSLLALVELGGKEAREALGLGLFDFDSHVRHAAKMTLRAVAGTRAWANAVRTLVRRAVAEEEVPHRRTMAVEALGQIRESSSVPLLIEALRASPPEVRLAAENALHEVTRHVLEGDADAWEAWWERNARRARFEWLVDALEGDDEEQRNAAHGELLEIVGEDLGFAPEGPEDERLEAIAAYRAWWDDENVSHQERKRKRKAKGAT